MGHILMNIVCVSLIRPYRQVARPPANGVGPSQGVGPCVNVQNMNIDAMLSIPAQLCKEIYSYVIVQPPSTTKAWPVT